MPGIAFQQLITPANIENITIQYTQPQSGNANGTTSIFVTFDTPLRTQQISQQEMKVYIGYLIIKATLAGQTVIATQFTNLRTVISVGAAEPLPVNNRYDIFVDANPINVNMANIINGTVLANNSWRTNILAGICSFQLPVLGDGTNFANEYTLPLPPNTFYYASNDGITWTVLFASYNPVDSVEAVNIVSIPQMLVENITANSTINFSDGGENNAIIPAAGKIIKQVLTQFSSAPFQSSFSTGATQTPGYGFIIQYFNGGILLQTDYEVSYSGVLAMPVGTNHIVISDQGYALTCQLIDDGIGGTSKINLNFMTQVLLGQCNANDGINLHIFVKATGVTTFAAAYSGGLLVGLIRSDINEAIDTGVPGMFVIGTEYVVNVSFVDQVSGLAKQIYSLAVNAQAAPPVTKNVFVLNTSLNPIVVTTDTASYPFAAGGSGNVLCTPGGICKNDSLTAQTFTFLQSLPATLAPLEAPNPELLGVGSIHNLNADITALNYIKVS